MKFQEGSFLIKEGCLKRGEQKRFYPYVFKVPEAVGEIQVNFSYSLRILKDKEKNYQMVREAVEEYVKGVATQEQRVSILNFFLRKSYPLGNLLNLSLYNAKGCFIGRWDQNSEKPVRISSTYSSPGFIARRVIPGFWTIEIEPYSIVTEECKYKLEISLIQRKEGRKLDSFKKN